LIGARYTTDSIHGRIDRAGEAVASRAGTFNLDTEAGGCVAKRRAEIDWVVSDLEEGIAIVVGVASCNIRRPISKRLAAVTPNTSIFCSNARIVDIEAATR